MSDRCNINASNTEAVHPSRSFITDNQRCDFRRWSEEINKLDDATKVEEGESWIVAALAILDTSQANGGVQ